MLRIVLAAAAALVLLLVLRFVVMSSTAKPPAHLADSDTALAPCPATPNCVSSLAERETQRVEPLEIGGGADAALEILMRALEGMPRTRVVTADGGYLHAECTSLIFRFVDDLELAYDAGVPGFHVRSASRSGYSDLGVNRKRVEDLRALIAAFRDG